MTNTELTALTTLVETETAAMLAENDGRRHKGASPAYTNAIEDTKAVHALRAELEARGVLPRADADDA